MNGILHRHRFVEPGQHSEGYVLGDHRQINLAIERLQNWCSEVDQLGSPRLNELGSRLRNLRELVAAHFAEEEEGGYLAEVLEKTPELAVDIAALEAQHREFLARFDQLSDRLCCVEPGFKHVSDAEREVKALLGDLRIHERREMDLVSAAQATSLGESD